MSEVGSPVWPANLWFSHWLLLLEMDCPDVQFVFQGILKLEKTFMFKPLICGDLSALQAQWHPVVWCWTEPLSTSLFAHGFLALCLTPATGYLKLQGCVCLQATRLQSCRIKSGAVCAGLGWLRAQAVDVAKQRWRSESWRQSCFPVSAFVQTGP